MVPRASVGPIRADVVGHRLHFCWRDLVLQSGLAEKIPHGSFPPIPLSWEFPTSFITPGLQPMPDSSHAEN